jgi:histidine phosphotransferase ChpT
MAMSARLAPISAVGGAFDVIVALLEAPGAFAKGRKTRDLIAIMPSPKIAPEDLASALAARLIHDAMGPASGIISAFDLIADPSAAAMRDDALVLASESARKLVDLLVVSRTIYAGGTALSAGDLRRAADRLFEGSRATLDLSLDPQAVSPITGRLLLGLLQIAAATVAAGGAVRARLMAQGDALVIEGDAKGARLRVAPEMLDGIAGRGPGEAAKHRWSSAYFLGALARSVGGEVEASVVDGGFVFRAVIKAEMA